MRLLFNLVGFGAVVTSVGVFLSGYTIASVVMLTAGTIFLALGMREKS